MSGFDSNGDHKLTFDGDDHLMGQVRYSVITDRAYAEFHGSMIEVVEPEWHADPAVLDASYKKDAERWLDSYCNHNSQSLRRRTGH